MTDERLLPLAGLTDALNPEKVIAGLERWADAEKILRALATGPEPLYRTIIGATWCTQCSAGPEFSRHASFSHQERCPWRMAVEWVTSMDAARGAGELS